MQTGVLVLDWNLCEAEKPILSVFLVIAGRNKTSLYHEATGVPCQNKKKTKQLPHMRSVSEILSADPDAQLSIFTRFGGPTLSQHIKGDTTDI